MASQVNELVVWTQMTPVVNAGVDSDFDVWDQITPDEDRDEGNTAATPTARRRVVDF